MNTTESKESRPEHIDEKGPDPQLENVKALNEEAAQATDAEHNMTLMQGIRTYKRAAMWSILISTTIIMEGYDTQLLANLWGYTAFRKKFGTYSGPENGYQISSSWQAGLNDISAVGNVVGALLNGWLTARYGHRVVLMASLAWLVAAIFMVFFAPNIVVLLIGEFLCNIPWGVFATTGPAYAAEVVPLALRGYLTAYINLCWCIGQFIAAGVFKGLVNNTTDWGYKIPFAVQWVWPVPLFIAALLAPESPWFLVRSGQLEKAKKSLIRLSEPGHNVDHDATIALMVRTDKLEKEERSGTSYSDCFKGTNRRRTEIAIMCFVSQITDGGALCYTGTFFYEQAGLSTNLSYDLGLVGTAIAFVGVIISWLYISRWGRRTIWLYGFYALVFCLYLIGILACIRPQTAALGLVQSIFSIVWLGAYSMSVGPIVYTIVAEIGSTRLRTQTVVLGRSSYYVANIVGGVLEPYFMSPTAWNAQGKTLLGSLNVERGILRLPVELLQHILVCLPDPRSLVRAVQSSPALYLSFKENEQHIVTTVLTNCIGTGVLREAQLARDCAPPVLSTEIAKQPFDLEEELQDKLDTMGRVQHHVDADVDDGAIQHLHTLGLEAILAIARLQEAPYTARERALNPEEMPAPENENFLNSALVDFNGRTCSAEDKDLSGTLYSAAPFHPDADAGSETSWRLSWPQGGSPETIFEQNAWMSRSWGYVLWDHARLQDPGLRDDVLIPAPWETAATPVSKHREPSWEERESSWRKRCALYRRGYRGY
ncbi:General alpha-glucoside permease [Cytospora mali]|uniref:General alpha-glucoside permease n=1 Tax=Cytospora mali TaxID=578113 RepID=A0A194V0G1_CYTMA|nr:General alpha-glucoside permease [Valsa mali var. pyri (nom. inval.)]